MTAGVDARRWGARGRTGPRGVGQARRRLVVALIALRCLGWTVLLLPVHLVVLVLRSPLAERLPRFFLGRVCRACNLDVVVLGEVSAARPTLFVANHCSYLDIVVLGGVLRGSFVAKREVEDWPVLGWYARLQRTVFIDRRARRTAAERDAMTARLAAGDNLILFPEGTTGCGNRLLPFRSAFFSLAERPAAGRPVMVQPVTMAYVRLNGMPLGHVGRARYAWYGDVPLGTHAWRALSGDRVTVVVQCHEPVEAAAFAGRKALAAHCFERIGRGLEAVLRGRVGAP